MTHSQLCWFYVSVNIFNRPLVQSQIQDVTYGGKPLGRPALGSIPNLGPRPPLMGSKIMPPPLPRPGPGPKGSRSPRPMENGSSGLFLSTETNYMYVNMSRDAQKRVSDQVQQKLSVQSQEKARIWKLGI